MKHVPSSTLIKAAARLSYRLALAGAFVALAACGSDGGSSTANSETINGLVVAAPVSGAAVVIKDTSGNVLVESVKTAGDGAYSLAIKSALPDLYVIEASGGTYVDEATGSTTTAGVLKAYVDGVKMKGKQVHVTPATTIVHDMVVEHGVTFAKALSDFEATFGFAADADVAPADATNPAAGASDEALLAGMRIAAFSQLTKDLGLSQEKQFELMTALAEDLADGQLDGAGTTGAIAMLPADIAARFSRSMVAFHESDKNKSGLANDKIGAIPFATVVMTDTYRVEYVPGMMKAMEGKTRFKLHITDKNTGAAETGLMVKLMAMMHMADHKHSTPDADCTEDLVNAGNYDCTVYYLMPSAMAGGMSMGYWELKIMPTMTETAVVYPPVMMAMGDTVKTKLKGQADTIKDMMGMDVSRNYFIFKDSLVGTGAMGGSPYRLTLFIAASESMMSFPALIDGNTLESGMGGTPLSVSGITVEVSLDGGSSWDTATDNGDGTWQITGLSLTAAASNEVVVRLTVNGERKTSDGTAGGLNAVFMLTPGSM